MDSMSDARAEAALYREAMSRLASAVHVVTTHGGEGRAGFTATAVASVSDAPPTLLVCLNRRIRSAAAFRASGTFAVNTLRGDQEPVAQAFGGRLALGGEERFAVGEWRDGRLGVPCLVGALASFECRLVEARSIATHDVLVGRVEAIVLGHEGPGLVYVGRGFRVV